jgi:hypothetical protein
MKCQKQLILIVVLAVTALVLIAAGAVLLGKNKSCQTTDDSCISAENQRKAGIALVVAGCATAVVVVVAAIIIRPDCREHKGLDTSALGPDVYEYTDSDVSGNSPPRGGVFVMEGDAQRLQSTLQSHRKHSGLSSS